ncbi:MAG: hypothetical protein ACTSQP_05550 [Promethearchaeota archaeon]
MKYSVELMKRKYIYIDDNTDVSPIINKMREYNINNLLVHTPSNIDYIKPIFNLIYINDLQLILGYGCYDSIELMKLVKEYNSYVDTSINPAENIKKWIENELEKNLVFGSDWPCAGTGLREFDWNAQKREIDKLKELELPKSFYNREILSL